MQHALWSFYNSDTYLTLYSTGKLLIQGKNLEELIRQCDLIPKEPQVGMDESGKGEVFGPLVACAAMILPENFIEVLKALPTDSKRLTQDQIFKKASVLKSLVEHHCKVLEPIELLKERDKLGNLNLVLDNLYRALAQNFPPNIRIIIDAYSPKSPIEGATYTPKAERFLPVAVASILARELYLSWLYQRGLKPVNSPKLAKEMLQKDPSTLAFIKTFFL